MFDISSFKATIKKYLKHRTFRNVGFLTIGQGLAQVVSLIGAFYIPRLLGPEQYGVYQTVIAYVGMFTIFTFSGLNKVILRESSRNLDKIKEILEATVGLRHLFSLFAIILSASIAVFIDYEKGTKFYIFIFSLSLWFKALDSTFNVIYQAHEKMKYMAVLSFMKPLLIVPLSILFLHLGYGVLTLILINLIITGIVLIFNYLISKKFVLFNIFTKVTWAKNYLKQGFNFSLLGFLNVLSGKIDLVMLYFLTTPEQVGIYALAYRIVQKGLIIRKPISTSLFPYYTKKFNNNIPKPNELLKHSMIITISLAALLLPLILYSEFIITTIVGDEFVGSASIFSVLAFFLLFNYSNIPYGLSLQTTNNENISIYLNILKAVLNIILNIILFNRYGIIGIAYSTLIIMFIHSLFLRYIVHFSNLFNKTKK